MTSLLLLLLLLDRQARTLMAEKAKRRGFLRTGVSFFGHELLHVADKSFQYTCGDLFK